MTSKTTSHSDLTCLDCGKEFEEAEAANASLDPNEYNPACPSCGSDHVDDWPSTWWTVPLEKD